MPTLIATTILLAVFGINRLIHGRRVGFNPWIAMIGSWSIVIALYLVNPLHLNHLHAGTWWLVYGALGAYTIGYGMTILGRRAAAAGIRLIPVLRPKPIAPITPGSIRALNIRRLWCGCVIWVALLLPLFLRFVIRLYGLRFYLALGSLRTYLGTASTAPVGFYFFYAALLMVPLGVVLYQTSTPRRSIYAVVSLLSLMSLLLTTGRTNAIIAILWTGIILVIQHGDRRFRLTIMIRIAGGALLVLVLFIALGDSIGKSYSNSALASQLTSSGVVPKSLRLPYLYVAGTLPALDQITTGQPPAHAAIVRTSMVTLRPLYQLARLADRHTNVPSKIQSYWSIPYEFNTSTFISPLYLDFGPEGVLAFSFLFGMFAAWSYLQWLARPDVGTGLLVSLLIVTALLSPSDMKLNDLSIFFQVGVIGIIVLLERRVSRRNATVRHGAAAGDFVRGIG